MKKFPGRRTAPEIRDFLGEEHVADLDVPMARGFYKWLFYGNRHHMIFLFIGLTVVVGAILWEWWYSEESGEEYTRHQIKEE